MNKIIFILFFAIGLGTAFANHHSIEIFSSICRQR